MQGYTGLFGDRVLDVQSVSVGGVEGAWRASLRSVGRFGIGSERTLKDIDLDNLLALLYYVEGFQQQDLNVVRTCLAA